MDKGRNRLELRLKRRAEYFYMCQRNFYLSGGLFSDYLGHNVFIFFVTHVSITECPTYTNFAYFKGGINLINHYF